MEEISSMFMAVVLIDVRRESFSFLEMERDTFSIFVGGLVFHHSLDFSREISLYIITDPRT
jgi:hypothetical protein